jgi:ABC-2 type transport system permease protein/lipopolysaccharide transport system permease protein
MGTGVTASYIGGVSHLGDFSRLLRYLSCLRILTLRALKVRYRRSVLGFMWSLLYPLSAMAVLTAVFSHVFSELPHYPVYVVVGFLAWGFFSLSCLQAMDGLHSAAPIMRKVYVPGAVFPVAVVGANLVNLLLSLLVLPAVIAVTGASPGFNPGLLTVAIVTMAAFTTGVSLALAAANLFFNDVRYFFESFLLVWFYATPVVYPEAAVPETARVLLRLNPFVWFLDLFRAALYTGETPSLATVAVACAVAGATLLLGWKIFVALEHRFYLYL